MSQRLSQEEVVTIGVLTAKGKNHCEIARTLGVSEGTVRYHLRRQAEGARDGRADKRFKAEVLAGLIEAWMEEHDGRKRPPNVKQLYEHLVYEWGFEGSYRSVLRYVRRHWPKPKLRTWRRVETPPGAQSQTDWAEFPSVAVRDNFEALSAFIMVLSHSRRPAIVWSRRKDQLSWLHCHNESFRRLRGVAAVNRIDNVKTAIASGAGPWGTIHPLYRAYARSVGFHIDACRPGQGQEKGKVEAKVRLSRLLIDPESRRWETLEELQSFTDERVTRWSRRAVCPATGNTVEESWQAELERLADLPILPEPFDVVVTRPVHQDCMVRFEDRLYPVPFRYAGSPVEVRGCSGKVQILADGRVVRQYPRHSRERILMDSSCWEGESTERVLAPQPLGKMGRRLEEIYQMPVEQRPIDLYQALTEVAR
jgi:transposase